jgi:two-component system phosphate regulon sensor histidine kinase PhoR
MNKALFKYFATVLIVTLLFSSSVSMVILSDQMMQTTRKDMYYTVKLVENQIDYQKPLDNQVDKLNDLAYTKDTRLTIIDKEGNVLADSDKEGIQENHSGRSEFKEALSDQFGYATRYSSTVKKNMMYVAYYHRGYVVRIAIPYNGIFDNIGPLLEPLFISVALSLCVALALSYRFSRTLTKPLEEISEEVSKINDNRYLSFDHYQYEEFNVIATKLKEQADTIRKTLKTLKN